MEQILLIDNVPALSSRYISYGSRTTSAQNDSTAKHRGPAARSTPAALSLPIVVDQLLDSVAEIQVPHAWFTHFYLVSVASSIFWGVQIFAQGSLLAVIDGCAGSPNRHDVVLLHQTVLAWALMSVQGSRRLLESTRARVPSTSRMFIAHWLLGIAFYLAMGVAIWVEGSGMKSLGAGGVVDL